MGITTAYHILPTPRSFQTDGRTFLAACLDLGGTRTWPGLLEAFAHDLGEFFGEDCVSPGSYLEERAHAAAIPESASLWGGNFFPDSAPIVTLSLNRVEGMRAGAYSLMARDDSIRINASDAEGARAGLSSLTQLMLAGWDGWRFRLPACDIEDGPEYSWRGVMLDCARHFLPVETLKKTIRALALYKLNRLHLHLTDDQGWRLELHSHPELTAAGSSRPGRDPHRDGFYSQAEIRDIVDFASKRGIQVMPEIDLPGHARSVLAARPELSCSGGPHSVWTGWGISDEVLCMGNPAALALVKDVWTEAASLFPAPWVHVGGDECPTTRWESCPRCQAEKERLGLGQFVELHGRFIGQVSEHLRSLGKKVFGWDEVLDSATDNGAGVFHWRQWMPELGKQTLERGRDLVRCPTFPYYFDFPQWRDRRSTSGMAYRVTEPSGMEQVYRYDPEAGLEPEPSLGGRQGSFLGVQANLWTEFVRDGKRLEYMLFPRALALAETAWRGRGKPGWKDFSERLVGHRRMLSTLGINACPEEPQNPV